MALVGELNETDPRQSGYYDVFAVLKKGNTVYNL
jgi:hypothetical protein